MTALSSHLIQYATGEKALSVSELKELQRKVDEQIELAEDHRTIETLNKAWWYLRCEIKTKEQADAVSEN